MRLKSINIYSSYLGDTAVTRERTGFLRQESDFLNYVFCKEIKYINNNYCKQLNIECNENVPNVVIGRFDVSGYPHIELPFIFDDYVRKTAYEKGQFWIKSLREIFFALSEKYEFEDEKIEVFFNHLNEKYNSTNMYEKVKRELQDSL